MKLAVFSDVHANLAALEAVLECSEGLGVSLRVCLGDLVGYHAEPQETIALIRRHADLIVAGNHDRDLFREASPGTQNAARLVQRWTAAALGPDDLEFLRALPSHAVKPQFVAAHGSYLSDIFVSGYVTSTMLEENLTAIRALHGFPALAFCGHTHVPMLGFHAGHKVEEHNLRTAVSWPANARAVLINPGAVGQPRDGDVRASFALVDCEARRCEVIRVAYDIERTVRALQKAGFSAELGERLREGR